MTVTTGSAAEAAEAARDIRARGIRMIKVKVGGKAGPAHDLARLQAIHEIAPDSPLILDGNAGVSRADATLLVHGLRARRITPALLEQWLARDDLAGAAAGNLGPFCEKPLDAFIPNYSLGNDKVRALYSALTGDQIATAAFWPGYKALITARNAAVHSSKRVREGEAICGCDAAESLIDHVDRVLQSL
jgi:hypothetical protein